MDKRRAAIARSWSLLFAVVCLMIAVPSARGDTAATTVSAPRTPFPPSTADVVLDYRVSLADLFRSLPGFRNLSGEGYLRAEVSTSTTPGVTGEDRVYTLRSDDAWLGKLPLGSFHLQATVPAGAKLVDVELLAKSGAFTLLHGRFTVALEVDPWNAAVRWVPGPVQGTWTVEGLDLDKLTDAWPVLALQGTLGATFTMSGTTDDPAIELRGNAARVNYRTEPMGNVSFAWKHEAKSSRFDVVWDADSRRLLTAHLDLPLELSLLEGKAKWLTGESLGLKIDAPDLETQRLRPFWVPPEGFRYRLAGTVEAKGPLATLEGALRLRASIVSGRRPPETLTALLTVGAERQELTVHLGKDLLDARLTAGLRLPDWESGASRAGDAPLEGNIAVNLPLPAAAPFFPSWIDHASGHFLSSLALGGTLRSPQVTGSISTRGVSAAVLPIAQKVEQVELTGKIENGKLDVAKVSARMGRGSVVGSGWVTMRSTGNGSFGSLLAFRTDAAAAFLTQRVPILIDGLPIGTAHGKVDVRLRSEPGKAALGFTLGGGKLLLSDETFPGPATPPVNPAVRVLDWLGRARTERSALAGDGELDLDVALSTPFELRAPGSTIVLDGKLGLVRKGRIARSTGGFRIRKGGVFHLFDNPFVIQNGVVTLLGGDIEAAARAQAAAAGDVALYDPDASPQAAPLDLIVDVLAEGRTVDTRVATEIRGPIRRPELLLASDPPLPEYQILTLLVTGRVDAIDDRNGQVRRQVEKLVSQFHNPGLKRQLFDRIGIDNLGFGFGAKVSEPILTIGKQINRQLYVESIYHHNAPPDTNTREGRVELRVDPLWTVDTAFGDAAEGRAGVHYSIGFGGPPRRRLGDTLSLFGKRRKPTDSDGDGLPDDADRCPFEAEDRDGFQDQDGCLDPDDDQDGVLDELDREPRLPETKNGYRDDDGAPDTAPVPVVWLGGDIRTLTLERGSANLTRSSRATLDAALRVLLDTKDLKVEIGGHTDDRGSRVLNREIGNRRARAVLLYLAGRGVAVERMTAVGYGPDRPAVVGDTEEERAQNRRIEMRLSR